MKMARRKTKNVKSTNQSEAPTRHFSRPHRQNERTHGSRNEFGPAHDEAERLGFKAKPNAPFQMMDKRAATTEARKADVAAFAENTTILLLKTELQWVFSKLNHLISSLKMTM